MTVTARWLTEPDELAALAPAWAALCDRCPSGSVFERPEWLLPWVAAFAGERAPRVLVLERGGALCGVLPLLEERAPPDEGAGPRLGFLGAGVSDYHDAVLADADSDSDGALRGALWRALLEREWSTCVLDQLRPRSPLLGALPGADHGVSAVDVERVPCPVLAVRADARTADDVLPEGFAARLARGWRKVAQAHRPAVRVPRTAAESETLFDALSALHGARWRARGEPGVLADPAVQRFHRRVIRAAWPAGLLRILGLELDGRVAAVVYGFAVHGRMAFYLGAFDPERASLSPGALAIAAAIDRLLGEGVRLFDFLRGRESYKYRFGAVDRPCFARTLRRSHALL